MSLRYSFRSEPDKHIFQFTGKCTTVEQLKKHIEYTRNIINVDVVNPITEKIYDNTILKRGLYVQIRTSLETSTFKAGSKAVSHSPSKMKPSSMSTSLQKRIFEADRKRKQQNLYVPKRVFKRKYNGSGSVEIPVLKSKGIPKRYCRTINVEKEKAEHLKEREIKCNIVARGDASLSL